MLRRQFMQLLGLSLIGPLFTRKAVAQIPPKKIVRNPGRMRAGITSISFVKFQVVLK